jgi:uncharacterized membrane protein
MSESPTPEPARSSTGLDPNIAGLLCYLLGIITGIVFLVIEKENRDVRFHAYQSLGTFVILFVLSFVVGFVPVIGAFVAFLLSPVSLILWIVLMVKAFQGERFKLPVVGDWAEEQAER